MSPLSFYSSRNTNVFSKDLWHLDLCTVPVSNGVAENFFPCDIRFHLDNKILTRSRYAIPAKIFELLNLNEPDFYLP